MTKTQARKILGISSSLSLKSAEQIYRQKCRKIHHRMAPGNTRLDRQKASDNMVELATAWKILKSQAPKPRTQTASNRRVDTHKPSYPEKPPCFAQDLAEAWDNLLSAIPLPTPLIILTIIVVPIVVLTALFIGH